MPILLTYWDLTVDRQRETEAATETWGSHTVSASLISKQVRRHNTLSCNSVTAAFVCVKIAGSTATTPTLFMAAWMDVLMSNKLSLVKQSVYHHLIVVSVSHCSVYSWWAGLRFSVANFAKFRGAICEILRNSAVLLVSSTNTLHSAASWRWFLLTDNTSVYKEFIVTYDTKTHYIGPLTYENIVVMSKNTIIKNGAMST